MRKREPTRFQDQDGEYKTYPLFHTCARKYSSLLPEAFDEIWHIMPAYAVFWFKKPLIEWVQSHG